MSRPASVEIKIQERDKELNESLLENQMSDKNISFLDDDQEKVLEQFRINIINETFPKNSPLNLIYNELMELFNKLLYEWSDGVWKKYDKQNQNLVENFFYSLVIAKFKLNGDEIQYLINVWQLCETTSYIKFKMKPAKKRKKKIVKKQNNVEFINSIIAFKEFKINLINTNQDRDKDIKTRGWRKQLDNNIKSLNSNGFMLENVLSTLLHKQSFAVIQRFYQLYDQTSYISNQADVIYKKMIERVVLEFGIGSIEKLENGIELLYLLLDHPKVGKNYIVKTDTFRELHKLGAKRVIETILSKRPFVGALDKEKNLIMANINRPQFEQFFNSLVNPQLIESHLIEMDVSCFIPPKEELEENPEYNEMKFFYHLADSRELRPLLVHPIIETLINLKYKKLNIFNWDLVLWRVLLMLLVLVNCLLPYEFIRVLSTFSFGILCVCVVYSNYKLLTDIRTFVLVVFDTTTLTFFFLFLYQNCVRSDCPNVTGFGGLVVALNITFILCYFSRHVSLNVFMLFIVARNAFKFIIAIFFMLVGFAYCLSKNFGELDGFGYIQTDEHNNTISPNITHLEKTIFKTFLMLTGELEAQDIPYLHLLSYAVFLVFVFLFPIVSINLLSGLAVGDVQQIISNARLWRLTTITMFLYYYEKALARRTWVNDVVDHIQPHFTTVWVFLKKFKLLKIIIELPTIFQFSIVWNCLKNFEFLKNTMEHPNILRYCTTVLNFLKKSELMEDILEHQTSSQCETFRKKCLYEDFTICSKIVFDLRIERVKNKNYPISRISAHTAKNMTEAIQEEKMRKRVSRKENSEIKEKETSKNCALQILDRINKIENQNKLILTNQVYLKGVIPSHLSQLTDQQHVRRKSL